jgi:glycosyltransferase involved in cell wall biosynthesis
MPSLLVIIPDAISVIVAKGEYQPRYYNPGNLFDEVHILMTNDDRVDVADVQRTVGNARLYLHNLPEDRRHFIQNYPFFKPWLLKRWAKPILTLAKRFQLWLLDRWAKPAVKLAREIQPTLMRCYGHQINTYVAYRIKKTLNIPYVVSLHGNPDVDYFRGRLAKIWEQKLTGVISFPTEIIGLRNADHVIAVYSPITSFLDQYGIKNYSVIYNVVGHNCIKKTHYDIDKKNVKCMCVGRQQSMEKDPTPIIDAVNEMPNAGLILIGSGDLHQTLITRVMNLNARSRVRFIESMPNTEVLELLNESDIFVYSSMNFEISKGCIEAALTGLPIIVNDRNGEPANELIGGHFLLVGGTKESYRYALDKLIRDDAFREQLGRKAYAYAQEHWAPEKTEAKYVEIYKRVMAKAGGDAARD